MQVFKLLLKYPLKTELISSLTTNACPLPFKVNHKRGLDISQDSLF